MLDTDMLIAALEIAGFSIVCCALFMGVSQRRLSPAYRLLAFLFFALMLSYVYDVARLLLVDPGQRLLDRLLMLSYAASFFVPPALLIYVRCLTGATLVNRGKEAFVHLVLPLVAVINAIGFVMLSDEARSGFSTGSLPLDKFGLTIFIVIATMILPFAFYVQCIVYTCLTLRTQVKHREQLKELFASTERYEVRWTTGMAFVLVLFGVLNLISYASIILGSGPRLPHVADSLLELLIVLTLAIWGLRQSPGMIGRATVVDDVKDTVKYEKSALDSDRAARIARKLQSAMQRDQLFQDPNLSLMSLSQHIGVSTNYASQSLNEHLGASFFDFVNGWRVEASKQMIIEGEQPITVIAYKVGFNSRSSFYTAFKKNTGTTPTAYAAAHQTPVALPT